MLETPALVLEACRVWGVLGKASGLEGLTLAHLPLGAIVVALFLDHSRATSALIFTTSCLLACVDHAGIGLSALVAFWPTWRTVRAHGMLAAGRAAVTAERLSLLERRGPADLGLNDARWRPGDTSRTSARRCDS